jgi:hypothetical protein
MSTDKWLRPALLLKSPLAELTPVCLTTVMSTDRTDSGVPHHCNVHWQVTPARLTTEKSTGRTDSGLPHHCDVQWQNWHRCASPLWCPMTELTSVCLTTVMSSDRTDIGLPHPCNVLWQVILACLTAEMQVLNNGANFLCRVAFNLRSDSLTLNFSHEWLLRSYKLHTAHLLIFGKQCSFDFTSVNTKVSESCVWIHMKSSSLCSFPEFYSSLENNPFVLT